MQSVFKANDSKYIIKPIDNRGARGVLQIDRKTDLKWAYNYCISKSRQKKIIIEKFLKRKQLSTESILYDKDSITPGMVERNYEHLKKFKPFIIENGGQQPVNLSKTKLKNISDLVVKAGRCLGIKKGIVKGDIVLYKNKPHIIEIATRLSGGWMSSHQIPIATGVDILKIAIKISLGEKIDLSNIKVKKGKATAIRYLFPKENSFFRKKKQIIKNKHVVKFFINLKNNQIVKKFTDHTARAGFVIISARSKHKAVFEAKKFINKLS